MIQRIRLSNCTLKLTVVASAEDIAEQQRQSEVASQIDDEEEVLG